MKIKRIKNLILTFVICLFGALTLHVADVKALELTSNNNYISSNLVNNSALVYGGIDGGDGSFTTSPFRARTNLIPYDASVNGTRLYLEMFDSGFCNNFVGVRMGIQTYSSNSISSHIVDSGWIPLTGSTAYDYYDVSSNTKYVAFVFSFSSTGTFVSTGQNEIISLNLNDLTCFKMYVGKDNVSKYQRYNELLYIGSPINSCNIIPTTGAFINCDGWIQYDLTSYDFSYIYYLLETGSFYENNPGKYYLELTYFDYRDILDGLYFESSASEGVLVQFYRDNSLIYTLDLSNYNVNVPFRLANFSNLEYNKIRITNINRDYKLDGYRVYDYEMVNNMIDYSYDLGYEEGNSSRNSLVGLVGAIFTGPVTMLQTIFNFDVLGINFAEMLLGLTTLLVVIWLVKRFI